MSKREDPPDDLVDTHVDKKLRSALKSGSSKKGKGKGKAAASSSSSSSNKGTPVNQRTRAARKQEKRRTSEEKSVLIDESHNQQLMISPRPEPAAEDPLADFDENSDVTELMQVSIEFFDPTEADYDGIKQLVNGYCDRNAFHKGKLVEHVIEQNTVGTVVKLSSSQSEDVFGVTSVVNMQRHAEATFVKQLRKYLLTAADRFADSETRQKLADATDAQADLQCGWVLSERMLNMPPAVALPLQQGLYDEITWAWEDEPTKELQDSFRFEWYLLLSRGHREWANDGKLRQQELLASQTGTTTTTSSSSSSSSSSGGKKGKKSGKKGAKKEGQYQQVDLSTLNFIKFEDEVYLKQAECAFAFPAMLSKETMHLKKAFDGDVAEYRVVMLVHKSRIPGIIKELQSDLAGTFEADADE